MSVLSTRRVSALIESRYGESRVDSPSDSQTTGQVRPTQLCRQRKHAFPKCPGQVSRLWAIIMLTCMSYGVMWQVVTAETFLLPKSIVHSFL